MLGEIAFLPRHGSTDQTFEIRPRNSPILEDVTHGIVAVRTCRVDWRATASWLEVEREALCLCRAGSRRASSERETFSRVE